VFDSHCLDLQYDQKTKNAKIRVWQKLQGQSTIISGGNIHPLLKQCCAGQGAAFVPKTSTINLAIVLQFNPATNEPTTNGKLQSSI